jgi:hypothetical protein
LTDSDRDVEPGREAIAQRTPVKSESNVAIVDPHQTSKRQNQHTLENIPLRRRISAAPGDAFDCKPWGLQALAIAKPWRLRSLGQGNLQGTLQEALKSRSAAPQRRRIRPRAALQPSAATK